MYEFFKYPLATPACFRVPAHETVILKLLMTSKTKMVALTLDNALACNQFLCYDASSAEHCPMAMVELHGLIFFCLLRILGRQIKGVEAVVKFLFAIIVGKC